MCVCVFSYKYVCALCICVCLPTFVCVNFFSRWPQLLCVHESNCYVIFSKLFYSISLHFLDFCFFFLLWQLAPLGLWGDDTNTTSKDDLLLVFWWVMNLSFKHPPLSEWACDHVPGLSQSKGIFQYPHLGILKAVRLCIRLTKHQQSILRTMLKMILSQFLTGF